ncbi:MAG: hypothetical protein A2X49_00015 [Lentisphaerae bacterium GWF2_52_8]|nr:MAG: hypothetical protein A2X49_00015 [Lentisphaerae bacterium GWF2_52_8]
MIIDAHQHVFWHGRNDADLIADMDQQKIDIAWLLSWEIARGEWQDVDYSKILNPIHRRGDGSHPGIPLSDLLIAKERHPSRFILGYCPHSAIGNAPDLFEAAVKIWGVKVCGEWKCRMLLDDPRCLNLFRRAGELKCPIIIHLQPAYLRNAQSGRMDYQSEWHGGSIENLARAAKACPASIFLGHGPGFWREISADADESPEGYPSGPVKPGGRLTAVMAGNPNIWADLSAGSGLMALKRDAEHAKEFLSRFADRIVFARDYFGDDLYVFLKTLDLPKDVSDKIMFANAQRILSSGKN